jgi:Ankyrin repeats (3 copies)
LHEQGCPWKEDEICWEAADFGSVDMLLYLKQQGCDFDEFTMAFAAAEGHLAVCQFLLAEQCPCDTDVCAYAAQNGHLETVRFLHESGCPWDDAGMCATAAESGNLELLKYLQQEGCTLTEYVMTIAAGRGDLHICQYLRAERCPWSAGTCRRAADGGHVDTLRWLHEQGCPWDAQTICYSAVTAGSLPVIEYVLSAEPAATAAQLTELLNVAGISDQLSVAQWLRQQGAEWPATLTFLGHPWGTAVLQWAKRELKHSCSLLYRNGR